MRGQRTDPAGRTASGRLAAGLALLAMMLLPAPAGADWQLRGSSVSTGGSSSCAVRLTGQVVCWGSNAAGQLGDGTTLDHSTPEPVLGLADAKEVAVGELHACALRIGGEVLCWGANQQGQLGLGDLESRLIPTAISGLAAVRSISAGERHTCVVRDDDQAFCWGDNGSGQLGDGSLATRKSPSAVLESENVFLISAGTMHSCAINREQQAFCWGDNGSGQLGVGNASLTTAPAEVLGLDDAVSISAGGRHSCAVRTSGRTDCWGENSNGQLGIGDLLGGNFVPTQVGGPYQGLVDGASVSAGGEHSCAVRTGGTVDCWGNNRDGGLGTGNTGSRQIPGAVLDLTGIIRVTAGRTGIHSQEGGTSCAVGIDDRIFCWGNNRAGQVGGGSFFERRPTPVPVLWQAWGLTVTGPDSEQGRVTDTTETIDCGSGDGCYGSWPRGATVTLIAEPEPGFALYRWSGACVGSEPTCQFTLDRSDAVQAEFRPAGSLTVNVAGTGDGSVVSSPSGIECGTDCEATYPEGRHVVLTAVPSPGSRFDGWSGACTGSSPTCVVEIWAAHLTTASFSPVPAACPDGWTGTPPACVEPEPGPENPDPDDPGPGNPGTKPLPDPPGGGMAMFDPATGRLAIRLKCPARFRPRCLKLTGTAVTGPGRKARAMSVTRTVRKVKAGGWKLVTLKIRPAFRQRVAVMAGANRKKLVVRAGVTFRKRVRGRQVKRRKAIRHRYRVRTIN